MMMRIKRYMHCNIIYLLYLVEIKRHGYFVNQSGTFDEMKMLAI